MRLLLVASLLVAGLAGTPRFATAQDGGFPVKTNRNTEFVMLNGEVVRRDGAVTTPLTQNVKLAGGTKINYKNGIVEAPGGKKTTLREGDYVKPDGGIVFVTPQSAAISRGETAPADAKYTPYVEHGVASPNASQEIYLLRRKVELLSQKVDVLSKNQSGSPDTGLLDRQLGELDTQLQQLRK
jgi:hypothetical protein